MGKKDPRVDAYIEKSADFAKPILKHLRKLVHAGCPEVEETLKWGMPSFMYHGILCGIAAFKAHCTFGFWKGALMTKLPESEKSNEAMGQYGRITSVAGLPKDKIIIGQIKEAARLNKEGVRVPKAKTKKKPPPKPPSYLATALKHNSKAKATFEAFSPSHQRDYIEWITEAKTDATREKRLATTLQWLAEGKSRNWKYERG